MTEASSHGLVDCRCPSTSRAGEANHHDDQTAQYLLHQHGSTCSRRGRPGRGHARRGARSRRDLPAGKVLGTESFPATAAGYRRLLVWARKRGTVRRAGAEGTGTFGAGLSRYLLTQQVEVHEVNRPDRSARRLLGKSDPLDAQAAALAVLSGRARAKSGDGPVHSARMLKLGQDSAVKARTQAVNQLKAVLVVADPALRERLSRLGNRELFRTCARLGPGDGEDGECTVAQATHMALRMLAERIEQLTGQIDELNQRLTRLVERHAPQLLEPVGIGPDSAVTLLITMGDNPERLNSEASFAALCGVSPVEYSSGRRSTRRLNHGGDRRANAALHRIVFTRLRHDPRTQAYFERRTQEGKTRREIIRCLKRYAAREVFNLVRPVSRTPAS
ncbi:IS110 family transposase [Streptomyces sp. NPDC017676]